MDDDDDRLRSAGFRTYGRFDVAESFVGSYGSPLPRPRFEAQCSLAMVVPKYRCGAAPDSNRIPY
jgi:hypothetical protein